ncbi:MAG: response regulator transcription factor [Planctomycetes bacterium]|nr:response regulator transcription factor [Planctomycetota bacterium]
MRILLAVDDPAVVEFVRNGFREDGHSVEAASGAADALLLARSSRPDLVVVDAAGGRGQELQLLRALRDVGPGVPIVAVIERGAVAEKNRALEAGASACLGKPFSVGELAAQARILLNQDGHPTELRFVDLVLDLLSRKAHRGGKEIQLTPREYSLLEYLMRHPEQVVTRRQIAQYAWSWDSSTDTNVVDVYINYLRNKVDLGFEVRLIHTIRGSGYVLRTEPA